MSGALAFIGAWSPDQARDESGRWTDGSGAAHYMGRGGHFSVIQQYQTDVHEVRAHVNGETRTVREYRDSYMAHAHAVQAAKGLRLAEGIEFIGAAADDPSPYKLSKFAAQHAAELVDAPKKERDAIRDEVRKALKNGEGPSGIADRLFGAIDKTPEEIQRIADTEYVIARTGAKLEQFDTAAGDDADAGKQWVLGDKEHCPTCIELAGQTVPLGEPFVTDDGEEFDGPPAHPNCDCDVEEADLSKTQARAAVQFVGAEFDEEKHPRDEKGQWTAQLDTFAEGVKSDLGLKTFSLHPSGRDLELNNLEVPSAKRNEGVGSKAMERLSAFADTHQVRVVLHPAHKGERDGTTSRTRLVKFYKRFGFVENKGRHQDFSISHAMYREPLKGKS